MTDTVTTDRTQPRFTSLPSSTEGFLGTPAPASSPQDVVEASKAAEDAFSRFIDSSGAANAARAEIARAAALDNAADTAAVSAGKPLPASRAEAAAREAFGLAQQGADAAQADYGDKARAFYRLCLARRDEWQQRQNDAIADVRAQAQKLLGELRAALNALDAERWTRTALAAIPANGPLSIVRWHGDPDYVEAVARADVETAERTGGHLGAYASARNPSVPHLLAALERSITA